jgi:hypothetical protein
MFAEAEAAAEGVESEAERSMGLTPPVDALQPLALFFQHMLVNEPADAAWLVIGLGELLLASMDCMFAEAEAAAEGVESEAERSMSLTPPVDALRPLALFLQCMLVNEPEDAAWLVIGLGELLFVSSAMITGGVSDSISEETLALAWTEACAQRRPLIAACSPATSRASPSMAVRSASASFPADAAARGSFPPLAASSKLRPSL